MPLNISNRNVKTKDRRQLGWYTSLEEELTSLICTSSTGIVIRQNKGSTCFVGPDNKPIFELACEGQNPGDYIFGIEKSSVDRIPALAAIPWHSTFRVIPVNSNDSAFYVVPLSDDAEIRRNRIVKLLETLGFNDDRRDEIGAAIDSLR